MAEPGWREESQNGGASADGVQGGSLGFPGRVEKGLGWGLPEPPRSPAGSHLPCPCSSVSGGAADIPVHHPGGGHHHGALCHRRTSGARRQAQRGGGRHGVLHVLPQLAPLSGRCQDHTARASAQGPEGTVDILPTHWPEPRLCWLWWPVQASHSHCLSGEWSPSPALRSCACPPSLAWGSRAPLLQARPLGKGVLIAQLRARFISGNAMACGVYAPLRVIL